MSRDLVLDVIAKKNSRDLSTLADEFDRLASKTDDAGKKMHETGTFSQFLDDQITKTKVHVKELGDEFDRTGSKDVFAKLRGAQGNLSSLERIKKDLSKALSDGGAEGGTEGGRRFSVDFGKEVEGFTSSVMPGLIGAGIAAAVAVAPGAILGATGLAGIGLGIVGQLHSPTVMQAARDAGHGIMAELGADTAPFASAIATALGDLSDAAKTALSQIDFGTLAADVVPLASALGGLIDNIMPGFNKALEAAQPVLQELEHDLPALGDAISQMFSMIADSGDGAKQSMRLLMVLLGGTAVAIGMVVDAAAHLYSGFLHVMDVGSQWAKDILGWIPGLGTLADKIHSLWDFLRSGDPASNVTKVGRAFHDMTDAVPPTQDALDQLSAKLSATTVTTDTLAAAMVDKLFRSLMDVDQGTLSVAESQTRLAESFQRNGRSIDIHTAKGQANREAILAAVQANEQLYQAEVASGTSAQEAAVHYDANTEALRKQLHNAHLTDDQINQLIGSYARVPDTVDTNIAANGLTDAIDNLGLLLAKAYGLDGKDFGFSVTETFKYRQEAIDRINSDNGHFASGGRIPGYAQGGLIEVGEQGRELLSLPAMSAPAYVTPNSTINGSANRRGGSDDVIGQLEVIHRAPSGEVIARELVSLGRRTGRKTFDSLIPVSTAR